MLNFVSIGDGVNGIFIGEKIVFNFFFFFKLEIEVEPVGTSCFRPVQRLFQVRKKVFSNFDFGSSILGRCILTN